MYKYYPTKYNAMAVGCDLKSSIVVEDHFAFSQRTVRTDDGENEQLYNTASLLYSENEFSWEGSLDELKAFVQNELKLRGKWTSPGGEVKLFTGVNVSVKWLGRKKRKLTISCDDINKTLIEKMKIIAAKSKNINTHKKLSEVCAAKQS